MTKKPLIAIVDDDEFMRETTKDLLHSAGFSAVTFTSAETFLKSKRARTVLCLITDMRMPGMTGLELPQRLVAVGHNIPTIPVTAYPDDVVRAQAAKSQFGNFAKVFMVHLPLRVKASAMINLSRTSH